MPGATRRVALSERAVRREVATRVAQGAVVCGLLCLGVRDGVTFTLMTCYYIHNH